VVDESHLYKIPNNQHYGSIGDQFYDRENNYKRNCKEMCNEKCQIINASGKRDEKLYIDLKNNIFEIKNLWGLRNIQK
jgi:hypothetical protein